MKDRAEFIAFDDSDVAVYLVVCGCATKCVDTALFRAGTVEVITGDKDAAAFTDFIKNMRR